VTHYEDVPHPISLKEASFKWNKSASDPITLKKITFEIEDGALVRKF